MHSDETLARPGTRRIYSNYGFAVLAETVQQATGIEFGRYLAEAVFEPLGMTATRLDGGAQAAGFGATSTVADLAAFAGDLLTPDDGIGADARRGDHRAVPRPGRGVARIRSAAAQRLGAGFRDQRRQVTALDRREKLGRAATAISVNQARSSGQIRRRSWRWWCSPTAISATGRCRCGRRWLDAVIAECNSD